MPIYEDYAGPLKSIRHFENGGLKYETFFHANKTEAGFRMYDEHHRLRFWRTNYASGDYKVEQTYELEHGIPQSSIKLFLDAYDNTVRKESYDDNGTLISAEEIGHTSVEQHSNHTTLCYTRKGIKVSDKMMDREQFIFEEIYYMPDGRVYYTVKSQKEPHAVLRKVYGERNELLDLRYVIFDHKNRPLQNYSLSRAYVDQDDPYTLAHREDMANFYSEYETQYKDELDKGEIPLTAEQEEQAPLLRTLLDMFSFDINQEHNSTIKPNMYFFNYLQEYAYDERGNETLNHKYILEEPESKFLLLEESEEREFDAQGHLVRNSYSLYEKEYDTFNTIRHQNTCDEQNRLLKVISTDRRNKIITTIYAYNEQDSGYTEKSYRNDQLIHTMIYDHYGNRIYDEQIFEDGSGKRTEENVITYY